MNSALNSMKRPYSGRLNVASAEASASISIGVPVCFPLNLNGDGYNVVLPSTAGATGTMFTAGIAAPTQTGGARPGQTFDVICMGFCNFTRLVRGTRAATTDTWPTFAAIGIGDIYTINTIANAVAYSTTADGAVPRGIQGAGLATATAISGLTAASAATAASGAYSAFSNQTAYTVAVRTWLRLLG
jgi:hypothetical protein